MLPSKGLHLSVHLFVFANNECNSAGNNISSILQSLQTGIFNGHTEIMEINKSKTESDKHITYIVQTSGGSRAFKAIDPWIKNIQTESDCVM